MKVQIIDNSFKLLEDFQDFKAGSSIPMVGGNRAYNAIMEAATEAGLVDVNGNIVPDEVMVLSEPVTPLSVLREQAKNAIDQKASEIRGTYITSGMDSTYLAKAQQTEDFIAAGYPVDLTGYGYISAELSRLGLDPAVLADRQTAADGIIAIRLQWLQVDGMIESARLTGKADVESRQAENTIETAKDSAIANLEALRNPA